MNTQAPILAIERINQRDGTNYILQTDADGTPRCPHCGTRMSRSTYGGDVFENSFCRCWWHGEADANYQLQVVVETTQEGEDAMRERLRSAAAERREKNAALAKIADEEAAVRRAGFIGTKATTRMQFVTTEYGTQPKKSEQSVEVEIVKAYRKEFSVHEGGATEVFDVRYPDGRVFFLRAKQCKVIA
jgi:hypothetical protein